MDSRSTHVLAIDLVRFCCAMMVVAVHYAALFPIENPLPRDWMWWSWPGWVGVELFFVISGYVIASSAASGDSADFLRRRVLRLAPAAWICASVTAAVILASGAEPLGVVAPKWLASMTFWPVATQIDGSYWTLGIEVAFYLLVAVTLRPGSVERVGLGLAVLSGGYWAWVGAGAPVANRAVDLLLLSYGGFFAAGIALWSIRLHGWNGVRLGSLLVGLGAGGAEIVATSAEMARGIGVTTGPWPPLALFASGLAVIVSADRLQPLLARTIGARRLATLGLMTYPLYLIHQRIGLIAIRAMIAAGVPGHLAMALAAALALLLAWGVVRVAEPVVRHWLAARLSRRRAPRRDSLPSASLPIG